MKRLKEFGKTLLIILLLCCLVLLAVASVPVETIRSDPNLSKLLQPFAPLLGLPEAELAYVETALPILDAAQPIAVSVCNSAGRTSAQWDFDALDQAYDTFGSMLGQALDTAELFAETNDAQLRRALSGSSVYFRYGCDLPADLLASWLGAELEADVPDTGAYLLSVEGDAVVLYLLGSTTLRSVTQADAASLELQLEQFRPDGSQFAFEADSSLEPMALLPGAVAAAPGAAVSNPCDSRYVDQLATDLGFNPYSEARFTDDDGVTYFSEANCTLEVSSTGQIRLNNAARDRFTASSGSDEALVELARQMMETAAGSVSGDGRLYLSGVTRQGEQTVCTFQYLVSGIPVVLGSDAAAVTFTGSTLTHMEIQVLAFSLSGQTLYPLPVAQAEAVLTEGSELTLQYHISGSELAAGWKK